MRTSFRPTEILQSVAEQTSIDVTEYVHGYVGVGPSTVCLGSANSFMWCGLRSVAVRTCVTSVAVHTVSIHIVRLGYVAVQTSVYLK